MAKRRKKAQKPDTPEKQRRRHEASIADTSALVGLPMSQRGEGTLELHIVPAIGAGPTPIKQTVRKLTRIEQLIRSGVLEAYEGAACEKYADWHAAGFEVGLGVTANYEGRSGGGGGAPDLLARHKAQMAAREDYLWARTFIPAPWLRLFESIVLGSDTIGDIAAQHFEQLKRSQAGDKTRAALKLCANRLHMGIAPLLPIDAPALAQKRQEAAPPAPPADQVEPTDASYQRVALAIIEAVLRAKVLGSKPGAIAMAPMTLAALERELGHAVSAFQGLTVVLRDGWGWGYVLIDAESADLAA